MKLVRFLAAAVVCLFVCFSVFAQKIVFHGKVIEVLDGSTIVVETPTPTIFVVKCPSTTSPQVDDPVGEESRRRLFTTLAGQTVVVEYIKSAENGRIVGSIIRKGDDVCLEQIRSGLASFDRDRQHELSASLRDLYKAGEARARNNQVGLWARSQDASSNGLRIPIDTSTTTQQPTRSTPLTSSRATPSSGPEVTVRGYFRLDGTYVEPHKRTAPDKTVDNNWSTVGNINPYTGKPGTKNWFARNWWIFPTVGALIGTGYLLRKSNLNGGRIPCNDGTFSPAQNRQGACSHHGGIRR